MRQNDSYFDSFKGKRYFHFVAYSNQQYSIKSFWKDCKVLGKNIDVSHNSSDFTIEHGKLVTPIRFHDENGKEDYSITKDKEPPFEYDIFAIELKSEKLLIFGFPFRSMGRYLLDKIFENNLLLKRGHFKKPDLNLLIKHANKNPEFTIPNFTAHFSSVELILTSETNISSVNLDGDKPLQSNLYRNVFLKRVEKDKCLLDRCSLTCETFFDEAAEIPKTNSITHLDLFGNFKLYIHGTGKNTFTIPFLFNFLSKNMFLRDTSSNPIHKYKEKVKP